MSRMSRSQFLRAGAASMAYGTLIACGGAAPGATTQTQTGAVATNDAAAEQ